MYLEEFGFSNQNLEKILHQLKNVHGIALNLNKSVDVLRNIQEQYTSVKNDILIESSYNSYYSLPEYTKAVLICEAIRIFLSEIAPERKNAKVRRKNKVSESSDSAGQTFDGNDLTDDYEEDRDPSDDGSPKTDFDYQELDSWIEDNFLIEPETGDDDSSSEFSDGLDSDAIGQEVADRYYATPGPDASDYADDRNIVAIDKIMDGPRHYEQDVIDKILSMPDPPGKQTKTGLPTELEKGVGSQSKGDRKNGVIKNDFHQTPQNDKQRDIPKPTDLQKENNKQMYGKSSESKVKPEKDSEEDKLEESLNTQSFSCNIARQMINELNSARNIGKIFESASVVAKHNKLHVADVLTAFELHANRLLEYNDPGDLMYNNAMLYALELIGQSKMRPLLVSAQQSAAGFDKLRKFLINKANSAGLSDQAAKKFVYAVMNAIINARLSLFKLDEPLYTDRV